MLRDVARFFAGSASWALLFVFSVAVGRILGPQDFGRFAWIAAIAYLFSPLLDAGFYRLSIRKASVRSSAAGLYLSHSLAWKAAAGVAVVLAAMVASSFVIPDPRLARCLVLLAAAGVVHAVTEALRAALIGRGFLVRDVVVLAGERAALLVVALWILFTDGGLLELCASILFVRSAAALAAWRLARPAMPRQFRLDSRFATAMAASGSLVAVAGVSLVLGGQLEVAMVGALRTPTEAGWYAAAHWMRSALLVVPAMMGAVLVPRIARRHHDDPEQFPALFAGGVKYACAAGMALAANGLLLAPWILSRLFGEGFAPAGGPLAILLLGLPSAFGLAFLQGSLLTLEGARRVLAVSVAGLAAQLALGVILIPAHGATGAAAGAVVAETALFAALYGAVRRRIPGVTGDIFLKAPAALAAAAAGIWIASDHGPFAQVAAANAVFASFLLLAGFVGAGERRALRAVLQRRPEPAPLESPANVE